MRKMKRHTLIMGSGYWRGNGWSRLDVLSFDTYHEPIERCRECTGDYPGRGWLAKPVATGGAFCTEGEG